MSRGFLLALFAWLAMAAAPPPRLVTDLSVDRIDISYSFSGADLLLFGAIEGLRGRMKKDIDIVVVVRGPSAPVVVRQKGRVAGIWLNVDSVELNTAPGFYAVASTRPIEKITDPQTATIYELGLDELHLSPTARSDQSAAELKEFRIGFLRLRGSEQLVSEQPEGVRVIGDILYRARVRIPANVPVGQFRAEVFLLHNGKVLARTKAEFEVAKSGFERSVYTFAHDHSLAYGLVAIAFALTAGWLAALAFRK
jgi:uncharacterized protein (TIGR02186 family)